MNFHTPFFRSSKNKAFMNIFSLFVLPLSILSLSMVITYAFSFTRSKLQIEATISASLKLISQMYETEFSNTISSSSSLLYSETFSDFIQDKASLSENGAIYSVSYALSRHKTDNPLLDDVYVIDRNTNSVISSTGVYSLAEYFDEEYKYEKYNSDYWSSFRFWGRNPYMILSPTHVTKSESEISTVVPIILHSINGIKLKKNVVLNIALDKFFQTHSSYQSITKNSAMFIMDRYSGNIFGTDDAYMFDSTQDQSLHKLLLDDSDSFSYVLNGKRTLVVSHSFSNNLLGYTYFAVIPYSDIYGSQIGIFILYFMIFLLFLGIAIYVSLKNSQKVALPIQSIASSLNADASEKNIFEFINSKILDLKLLNDNLASTLPYAQEKYLISFLNSTDWSIDESTKLILNTTLPFKHKNFASVIFNISFKKEFFNAFSPQEYDTIISGLYKVVKYIFTDYFSVLSLLPDSNMLCLVLNSDNENELSNRNIEAALSNVYNTIKFDNAYIDIFVGAGHFEPELSGLKKSYTEALQSIKAVNLSTVHLHFSAKASKTHMLSEKDEAALLNYLIAFDTESAEGLIKRLIDDCDDSRQMKYIDTQAVNIIFRVMAKKNILDNELLNEYISITEKSHSDIFKYILILLSKIDSVKQNIDINNSGYEIIEYIKQNFADMAISLDSLAELFHVTPGYISQLIKKNLHVNFHTYLSSLRIAHAKELLVSTDKSIQEIYSESGYFSKQTFFRVFKNETGMTPNEYRKTTKF